MYQSTTYTNWFVATILAIGYWFRLALSFNRTLSTFAIFCCTIPLVPCGEPNSTSFLYLSQNSLQICCSLLQFLWQYVSEDGKTCSGDIKVFHFIEKRFIGPSEIGLLRSLIASNFSGWGLTTAFTATSSVCSDPSGKFPSWVFNKEMIITLALQNWCSQTRPILLANSRLFFNWSIPHHDLLNNYWFFNKPFLEMHEWTLSKKGFIDFLTLSCEYSPL